MAYFIPLENLYFSSTYLDSMILCPTYISDSNQHGQLSIHKIESFGLIEHIQKWGPHVLCTTNPALVCGAPLFQRDLHMVVEGSGLVSMHTASIDSG
jgi:hypothetical protein